jgi:hypothetical protein
MKEKNESLSVNRFRDRDISTLSDEEYQDYVLAKLMQSVIQTLEVAIHNDRIFNRSRFTVFTEFWQAREDLTNRKKGDA